MAKAAPKEKETKKDVIKKGDKFGYVVISTTRRGRGAAYRTLQLAMAWGRSVLDGGVLGKKEWTFCYKPDSKEAEWEPEYKDHEWNTPELKQRLGVILKYANEHYEQEPAATAWQNVLDHLAQLEDEFSDGIQIVFRTSIPEHPLTNINTELWQVLGRSLGLQFRNIDDDLTAKAKTGRPVYTLVERLFVAPIVYRQRIFPQILTEYRLGHKLDPATILADEAQVVCYNYLLVTQLATFGLAAESQMSTMCNVEFDKLKRLAPAAPPPAPGVDAAEDARQIADLVKAGAQALAKVL